MILVNTSFGIEWSVVAVIKLQYLKWYVLVIRWHHSHNSTTDRFVKRLTTDTEIQDCWIYNLLSMFCRVWRREQNVALLIDVTGRLFYLTFSVVWLQSLQINSERRKWLGTYILLLHNTAIQSKWLVFQGGLVRGIHWSPLNTGSFISNDTPVQCNTQDKRYNKENRGKKDRHEWGLLTSFSPTCLYCSLYYYVQK